MRQNNDGKVGPQGSLYVKLIDTRRVSFWWKLRNSFTTKFLKGWFTVCVIAPIAQFLGLATSYGTLEAVKITLSDEDKLIFKFKMDQALSIVEEKTRNIAMMDAQKWAWQNGIKTDYGIVAYRVVTTAFVSFVVDQLQTETSVFGDFKFHDSGVGTTAENAADTAIETTDGESRATGTQTESAANAYRSVGTISYTSTKAITEHGLFNDASAGTLMDRSVFSAINVVNGDSIQFTYTITLSAGG